MSIKKHQQWVPSEQKVVGVVDLGGGIVDEETIASEALVLMAVGIRKRWKSPVSFHFTKGLSSETQKTIILDAVEQLFMVGVHVRVIICDGASVNLATLNQLGCSIPEQVAFTHPVTKQTIYCMLNLVHNNDQGPTHMLWGQQNFRYSGWHSQMGAHNQTTQPTARRPSSSHQQTQKTAH